MKAAALKAGMRVLYRCRMAHVGGWDCGLKEGAVGVVSVSPKVTAREVWVEFDDARGGRVSEKVPILDLRLAGDGHE